jgi:hypothetical protein
LVVWNIFYFSIYWVHHPNWLKWLIFFRGVDIPPTSYLKKSPETRFQRLRKVSEFQQGRIKDARHLESLPARASAHCGLVRPCVCWCQSWKGTQTGPKRKTASIRGVHKWIPKMVGLWKIPW